MTETPAPAAGARRRGLLLIATVVVLSAGAYLAWQQLFHAQRQSTDNAYVAGNVVQVTPQVAGAVQAILADDTDRVRAGQVLVQLDAADARLALEQARAQLAQTVREVRAQFAGNEALAAQVRLREAERERVALDVGRAREDVERRRPLLEGGAVAREEFEHARAQLAAAQGSLAAADAAVRAAREQLAVAQVQTDGLTPQSHPAVQRAATRLREAWLGLQRTTLLAPIDGHVARRAVQVGQRVQPGTPLMTLVALDSLWVDANFKEGQLRDLRIGQPAQVQADVYGRKVVYSGRVAGLAAGTGSAFALLPAQNATGNWIKVVQRVPVRIALDPQELARHPLRVGLSMEVSVDTRDTSGPALATAVRQQPVAQTDIFEALDREADAEVARVIAGGRARAPARTVPAAPAAPAARAASSARR